jgi:uncharacterized membrane protein YsdA (DUF1294 family)
MDVVIDFLKENFTIIICFYLLISLVTMLYYKHDKMLAINGKYRISEAKLLALPWLFGSLGGILGMYLFRHKTKKIYFILNNYTSLILHIALFIYLYTY